MVVRFVCVIRVSVCARVSRVCPGSPGIFLPVLPPVLCFRRLSPIDVTFLTDLLAVVLTHPFYRRRNRICMKEDTLPMLQPARRCNFELKAGLRSRTAVAVVIATALAALAIISVSATRSYVDPSELDPQSVSGSFGPPRQCPASPAHTAAHPYNMCSMQPSLTALSLRWGSDKEVADRICCRNTMWAECEQLISLSPSLRHPGPSDEWPYCRAPHADSGYWQSTSFPRVLPAGVTEITFYDVATDLPLFVAPRGRTWSEFYAESLHHGWPSFRDAEVVQSNVCVHSNGETQSVNGTHLGHNLPDSHGNRYCIDLVCVAGLGPVA